MKRAPVNTKCALANRESDTSHSVHLTISTQHRKRNMPRHRIAVWAGVVFPAVLAAAPSLRAQQLAFDLDPNRTKVEFTLGADFHTVHGTFSLKHGSIHLDPATHTAGGLIVVDATSGNTGNATRDRRMHREVLESDKYPEITFAPDGFEGQIVPAGDFQLVVHGIFRIHGAGHEINLPVKAKRDPNGVSATLEFAIPYVRWGLKNPSTFFLRVSDQIDVGIQTFAAAAPQ